MLHGSSPTFQLPTVTCCDAGFLDGGGEACQASFFRLADLGVSLDFGLEILLGAVFCILPWEAYIYCLS